MIYNICLWLNPPGSYQWNLPCGVQGNDKRLSAVFSGVKMIFVQLDVFFDERSRHDDTPLERILPTNLD